MFLKPISLLGQELALCVVGCIRLSMWLGWKRRAFVEIVAAHLQGPEA